MSESQQVGEEQIISMQEQQDFLRQVATLRNSLEGQTVVNLGSTWTAEAREPDRKQRLHNQLTLARQLRARLEQAADAAEALTSTTRVERLQILQQRTEDVNTLVSLTQAVKHRYTLNRYDEYSRNLRKTPVLSAETKNRDIIAKHLIAMKEERENPLGAQSAVLSATVSSRNAAGRPAKRARGSRKLPASRGSTKRQSPSDSESPSREPAASRHAAMPPSEEAYFEYHSSEDEEYAPDLGKSAASIRARRRLSAKRIKRRSVASRRCHDCKSSTTYFRRCHYWFLTGTKCSKTFCSKCLVFKYGCPNEEKWDMNDPNWHCPSCLGTCLCSDCVKERKRALRKESNYHTRRARSSYTGP